MSKFLFNLLKIAVAAITLAFIFYLVPERNLNVSPVYQYPNMPNGCEVASLDAVLRYDGFNISKENLSDRYLKKGSLGSFTPDEAYIGNPYRKDGLYCYAKPISDCANGYFKDVNADFTAYDETGMGVTGVLNNIIFKKRPVIVWYTIDDKSPSYGEGYYTDRLGNKMRTYSNLHCVVVDGIGRGKISIVDPIKGRRKIGFFQFASLYNAMGNRAVVIQKNSSV